MTNRDRLYHFLLAHCPDQAAALADAIAPLQEEMIELQARVLEAWRLAAPDMTAEQRAAIGAAMIAAQAGAETTRGMAAELASAAERSSEL